MAVYGRTKDGALMDHEHHYHYVNDIAYCCKCQEDEYGKIPNEYGKIPIWNIIPKENFFTVYWPFPPIDDSDIRTVH